MDHGTLYHPLISAMGEMRRIQKPGRLHMESGKEVVPPPLVLAPEDLFKDKEN